MECFFNTDITWESTILFITNATTSLQGFEQSEELQQNSICSKDKLHDKNYIIWNKNYQNKSNCDEWKFSNQNDRIFTRNETIKILTNLTIISVGISVDRRLAYTFRY